MDDSSQRTAHFDQLLERAAYICEAVGYSSAMKSTTPGLGQAYLAAYVHNRGAWLDGGQRYRLRVPAKPPARTSVVWSLIVVALIVTLFENKPALETAWM